MCKNGVCSPDLTKEKNCQLDIDCAQGKYCDKTDAICYDVKNMGMPCT